MSVQIAVRIPERDVELLDAAVRTGRFESRAAALREGVGKLLAAEHEREIAEQYRRAYERYPQEAELGASGAELMAEAIEADERQRDPGQGGA